jgi:hypothetical protein
MVKEPEDDMTENSDEIAELKRAHVALESKFETILPTLATKADLEAMGRHISEEMNRRFEDLTRRFETRCDEMNRSMSEGFNRIWLWIAGTLVAVLVAILGSSWFAPASPPAPVIYQLYPPGYTAEPAPRLAPPPQP